MTDSVEDIIQRPLQVVEAQFNQALQANKGQLPQEQDWGVGEVFRNSIDDNVLERVRSAPPNCDTDTDSSVSNSFFWPTLQIPIVNRKNLQQGFLAPNTLVRYRGMVQDMFSPEYFQAVHQVTTPSGGMYFVQFLRFFYTPNEDVLALCLQNRNCSPQSIRIRLTLRLPAVWRVSNYSPGKPSPLFAAF